MWACHQHHRLLPVGTRSILPLVTHHWLATTCHEWPTAGGNLNTWHKGREMRTSLGCCLTARSASWEEINMWFPVFCECFALCLLFNSCLHAQHFITYGCLMKTFLSCFWPQAFTMCFNPPFKQLLHMLACCCPQRATAGVWYSSWGGNWGGGS